MTGNALLSLKNVNVGYKTLTGTVYAANDINLDLYESDALGIVGESGSGKSTLAMGVLDLLADNAKVTGKAIFNGKNLIGLSEKEMRAIRWREISVVFQKSMNSFSPVYKIGEQIYDIYKVHKPSATRAESDAAITRLLGVVNLTDRVLNMYQHQLSGGMLQRICIALSLIFDPKIVVFDEATTALDVVTQGQVIGEIKRLQRDFNVSSILITHDISVVAETCNRVAVMYAGYLMETGPVRSVIKEPLHPYTQGLISSFPTLETGKTMIRGIPGTLPNLKNKVQGCVFAPRCPRAKDICRNERPLQRCVTPEHMVACHFYGRE